MTGPAPYAPPAVVPGVFDVAAVIGWLTALPGAPAVPLLPGGTAAAVPDTPDEIGLITATGASDAGLDGLGIGPRFQLRFRGRQDVPLSADRLALAYDAAIFAADLPAAVNGVRLLSVRWAASGPAGLTAGVGRRPETACTYLFRIIRPV